MTLNEFNNYEDVGLTLLHDFVLIAPVEEETTQSGLFMPNGTLGHTRRGIVVHIGLGSVTNKGVRIESDLRIDDEVIILKNDGTEVKIDGDIYLIIRESSVLAVVGNIGEQNENGSEG